MTRSLPVASTAMSRPGDTLVVSEIFGPTFQGEGPSLGRRAAFVRLGRCDLHCSWCDTPYTWDWDGRNGTAFDPARELTTRPVDEVVDEALALDTPLVVITGGEPLLQHRAVTAAVAALVAADREVEIETNGRHGPLAGTEFSAVRYNVSPKLANAGDPESARIRPDTLVALAAANSVFKFVCGDPADLDEVAAVVSVADLPPDRVWISPLGTTPGTVTAATAAIADAVLERGWQLSSRLHVLAWGDERGR